MAELWNLVGSQALATAVSVLVVLAYIAAFGLQLVSLGRRDLRVLLWALVAASLLATGLSFMTGVIEGVERYARASSSVQAVFRANLHQGDALARMFYPLSGGLLMAALMTAGTGAIHVLVARREPART